MAQNQQPALDDHAVREAYRLWAPIYDYSFGLVAGPGRRLAVQKLNEAEGRVLEIGVGTGLSLPRYKPSLEVTGIDLSPDMLAKASERVETLKLPHKTLSVMDAGRLAFANESFDAAAVMYVMTVVPEPAAVMAEMWRILRPGGTAIVVNHFSRERGLRAAAEQGLRAIFAAARLASHFSFKNRDRSARIPARRNDRSSAVWAFHASASSESRLKLCHRLA